MSQNKQNGMAPAFPLFIGAVIAAVAFSQDNRGGAVLGLVAGAVISLIVSVRRRKR
ncbi:MULTISPECIES: hypothetical protein [Streptomyces]|uniref:Uncharacterized protein n=1 Tax=Streptomyces doudnae TaxID=3075536 RepID=A0ABD5EWJ3_9ACTN|nr:MULTISPECIES: hypothetical protein [unclassified Streptomyces]MDT0438230.1 hypothetical protein [Streptomyces sp. DSM 41981]MYQ65995.1 hypothetical protein [Streptomyces sp. SID4950]SCE11979.1 PEP-CTERM protein-sorting domain-containing protein [Streptomyces sp. SolWspMP-5a-2]